MGNFSSKDSHGPSGAHQDIFCTPPTSPVTDVPTTPQPTIPVPPAPHPVSSGTQSKPSTCLTPSKPPPDWKPPPPNRTNPWSTQNKARGATVTKRQDSAERNGGLSSSTPRTQVSLGKVVPTSPAKSLSLSSVSMSPAATPSALAWGERDSGLSHSLGHGVSEDQGEEMEQLWQECSTTLGSSASPDTAVNTTELLRCLLTEVKSLRSTLQTERSEWLQFQSDLQVAVAVADRLRAEAEEELAVLQTAHKDTERELSAAQQRQKEAHMQLVTLRGELRESRQKLATMTQAPGKPEVQAQSRASEKPSAETTTCDIQEQPQRGRERSLYRLGQDKTPDSGCRGEGTNNIVLPEARMDSMGVAKRYLRNVTNEDRIGEDSRTNDPQRVVTTDRSRSLSRLPASSDPPAAQNGNSQSNIGTTTGCTNKKQSQPKGQKSVDCQDSWSGIHIGKREDSLNKYNSSLTELPPTKSQDGFNLLVRRHGGSKRNSLLRWCQGRTQGYKNIDITNFSSSWVDGLAFCAVYHTYLPSHIPYSTLSPESKRENLNLAFKTGENVGITQSLTVEEMLRSVGPDWQRVLSYVESMYRHFEM